MYHYLVIDIYFILLIYDFYQIITWCELNQYAQNASAPRVSIIHGYVALILTCIISSEFFKLRLEGAFLHGIFPL